MENLQELIALGKNLTILYVEDDERLQQETHKMLSRIFKNIVVASDGKQGYEAFKNNDVDLVITDIEMPVMSGLAMTKLLKKENRECPVVVVSAYTDVNYFLEAIEYDVDYYVLKPVNTQKFLQTLYLVCRRIEDMNIAKEYKEKQLKETLADERQLMLEQVSNCSPNPMLVYAEGKLRFFNQAFASSFVEMGTERAIETPEYLSVYLEDRMIIDELLKDKVVPMENFNIEELSDTYNISVKTLQGKKVFYIIRSDFNLEDNSKAVMYTFNDVTELIYQQAQLALYNKQIDSLVEDRFLTRTPKNEGIINKVEF
jgi:YesN/AraC family two-component response regulator